MKQKWESCLKSWIPEIHYHTDRLEGGPTRRMGFSDDRRSQRDGRGARKGFSVQESRLGWAGGGGCPGLEGHLGMGAEGGVASAWETSSAAQSSSNRPSPRGSCERSLLVQVQGCGACAEPGACPVLFCLWKVPTRFHNPMMRSFLPMVNRIFGRIHAKQHREA